MVKAGTRAVLVAVLISMPALLLPQTTADATQFIALLALIGALLAFVEYVGDYPSIIEFRDAPPFNRLRFLALFATVLILTLISRGEVAPSALSDSLQGLGHSIGEVLDFPYSPVRLMVLGASADLTVGQGEMIRTHAGIAYLVSLLATAGFVLVVRVLNWPTRSGAFNFWVNLPLFDPTAGGDVLRRLKRDALVNIVLGLLLPFLIPALMKLATAAFAPISLANVHSLIWITSAWAFLPASLIMRGVALMRIAELVEEKRRRAYAQADLQAA